MKRLPGFVPLLAALSATLGGAAAFLVWPVFDGLYGQDPFAYYDYALGPLDEALRRGELPTGFFWPPGFPLLIWSAAQALGPSPLAGQAVALIGGVLVPLFTALLAWELFVAPGQGADVPHRSVSPPRRPVPPQQRSGDRRPGLPDSPPATVWLPLIAGVLAALPGQLWQSSVVVMSDTPALAAGTAGVWLTARWAGSGRAIHLWGAAGLLGLAVLTRWAYGLVALPVTAFAVSRLTRSVRGSAPRRWREISGAGPVRTALIQATGAVVVVSAILLPVWLPTIRELPAGTGGLERSFTGNFAVYRWSPLNAVRRTFETADGLLRYRLPNGLYYSLTPAHRYFFTPLLASFLLPGAWVLVRCRNASRLWLILGWAAAVIAFHAGAAYQNFRFTLAYLPPLAILAGLGILVVWAWAVEVVDGRVRAMARAAVVGWVVIGVGWMVRGGVELTTSFVDRKRADLATVDWVEARTPRDARLVAFNMYFTLDHYASREALHLFGQTPETLAPLVASSRPLYLLLETESFVPQWGGHPAGDAFRWLQEGPGLAELGRSREYILYRVGGTNRRPGSQVHLRIEEPSPLPPSWTAARGPPPLPITLPARAPAPAPAGAPGSDP